MNRCLLFISIFLISKEAFTQHPIAYFTRAEAAAVKKDLQRFPLLRASFGDIKNEVDPWLGKEVDVPFPKDPAGGYTHDRHKANYTLMFNSGVLYQLTGDARYATLVKNTLLKYADLNPKLGKHPHATSSSPGHIFWQALNDANWLVYSGLAYDLVHETISPGDRAKIETGAFKPEVDYFTKDLKGWFNLIHNHGVWACAGVGIVGIATGNNEYVEMALKGTGRDGKGGFLSQMNNLFSPDGYYTEGPYYVRYALLPFYIFASSLHHARPDLKIFEHRGQILRKALLAGLQQTNTNGTFLPFNDAIKQKDVTTNELVTAIGIAWDVYGNDAGLLSIAKRQGRVSLSRGGASIAAALASGTAVPSIYPYKSVEYVDGANGDKGGISILRTGKDENLTTLLFKYAAHGLSHGHYDQLGFSLFDKGNEVFQDYGSVRYVNVEQKYGGRYLPENDRFAAQTIAHSTLVADEQSHFNGNEDEAEKYHGVKLFSSIGGASLQAVSAREDHAYSDIKMGRSLYLLQLPGNNRRFLVDLFLAASPSQHQYDLPFQFAGQVMKTSFPYKAHTTTRETLGKKNGYQFYWKEAEAEAKGPLAQFTFLNGKTYYTVSSLVDDSSRLFFVRAGANDPDFNLRPEPAFIVRKKGAGQIFLNVIEIHGGYNAVAEVSKDSYPSVTGLRILNHSQYNTVAEIRLGKDILLVAQANIPAAAGSMNEVRDERADLKWEGPFAVWYNGTRLQAGK